MGIKTTTFGGHQLTGKDAAAFRVQFAQSRPSVAARAALAEGKPLYREFQKSGKVTLKPKK